MILSSQHQPPRDRSRDQSQIEVDYEIYRFLFNQAEDGILVRDMTIIIIIGDGKFKDSDRNTNNKNSLTY